jgi:hypothetical protein
VGSIGSSDGSVQDTFHRSCRSARTRNRAGEPEGVSDMPPSERCRPTVSRGYRQSRASGAFAERVWPPW